MYYMTITMSKLYGVFDVSLCFSSDKENNPFA